MNEGGCDPDGRFWCGSMAYDQRPDGAALHRLDPDGSARRVLDGVTVSNGLDWSPDGSLAYYDDTATGRVDVFDYDPATGLTGRRPFVELSAGEQPDGLTVDADGGVWVAVNGSGVVRRYRADGVLDGVVELPTAKVTACTFGGPAPGPAVHHHVARGHGAGRGPDRRVAVPGRRRRHGRAGARVRRLSRPP